MHHSKKLTEQVTFIVSSSSDSKGWTLPVWVAAAVKAATEVLTGQTFMAMQEVGLPNRQESINIPVTSAALIAEGQQAIAITHADSGIPLDITRGLEIWAIVGLQQQIPDDYAFRAPASDSWLQLVAGTGVGTYETNGDFCLSDFARDLLHCNLRCLVPKDHFLRVEIVFPDGRQLAQRTSNESFGVVDGLALIGTQAEAQTSASPQQLQKTIKALRSQASASTFSFPLTFVIGENGLDLAVKLGIPSNQIFKVGNWLGPLLVVAAEIGVKNLLLLGYHGKLVKLAGGIFHTHHHLADGRLEVLIALAVAEGIPLHLIQVMSRLDSMQAALLELEASDPKLAQKLWARMACVVELRSNAYVTRYGSWHIEIGAALFDRQRRLRWAGPFGSKQLDVLGVSLES